jgi:hypothetical protein
MSRTLQVVALLAAAAVTASAEVTGVAQTARQHGGGTYLGFDTNKYPGEAAMDAWKKSGKYDWVGYYLEAPCHSDDSWSGKRARLTQSGWGMAVIYVGQQTWGKSIPVTTSTGNDCSTKLVNAAQGKVDARHAIDMAKREGFDQGTVIFLDVEAMSSVPRGMRDYYASWARTLIADGRYLPGIYSHTKNAEQIYDDVKAVYKQAGRAGGPPFWIASTRGFSERADPTDVGHDFADMWQGQLDITRTHGGVKLPVDISVAAVSSPSEGLD